MARGTKRPKPGKLAEFHASVVRGPDEQKRWYWRVRRTRNGVEETVSTGWWFEYEIDRVLAGLITHGVDSPRARNRVETVRDLIEFWIGEQEQRADLSARTLEIRRAGARHVRDGLGAVVLESLDRLCLERYRDRRLREPVCVLRKRRDKDGAPVRIAGEGGKLVDVWDPFETGRTTAPRTVAFEIHVLRMAWRWGREVGVVPIRELPRVAVRVQGHVRDRHTPSRQEARLVMQQLDGWARLALILYEGTGARLDEIATLRWRDVNFESCEVTVKGKTGPRVIAVNPPVLHALRTEGVGEPDARVLTCAHSTARAIYDRLKVACAHAKVRYFAPGGLRRAGVIALYQSGMDPSVAGAIIGHSPVVAMRHYRQIANEEKRDGMRLARLGYLSEDPDSNVVELPKRRSDG